VAAGAGLKTSHAVPAAEQGGPVDAFVAAFACFAAET
jgi:hypothetical protein